jgi:hypothetical protein
MWGLMFALGWDGQAMLWMWHSPAGRCSRQHKHDAVMRKPFVLVLVQVLWQRMAGGTARVVKVQLAHWGQLVANVICASSSCSGTYEGATMHLFG